VTACLSQHKEDQTVIYFCLRPSIMGNAAPENHVGEGGSPPSGEPGGGGEKRRDEAAQR
jgi:hypothetical protein